MGGQAFAQLKFQQLEKLTSSSFAKSISDFRQFLSIPNNGRNRQDIENNLEWCRQQFSDRGFKLEKLDNDNFPLLLAQKEYPKAKHTVLFYTQIDGQPVDNSLWDQPNPYQAVLKEKNDNGDWVIIPWERDKPDFDSKIFARSTADSKGPAMMLMTAIEILNSNKITPAYNIKILMDFQEELGSPGLIDVVKNYQDLLMADYMVIMDGTRSVVNEPTLTFGARGIATISLKIFGPQKEAHSGQFGNYAPNPVFTASSLIASMKDESGRVRIPGFYEGVVLTDQEKKAINEVPDDEEAILKSLGIAKPERVGETYQESLQFPSLNVRGLKSAWTGDEVRTVIPSEVIIEFDMRLVPETPGERQVQLVRNFIESRGFHFVDGQPTAVEREAYSKLASLEYRIGSLPFRTELDSPMGEWLAKAIIRATGKEAIKMRTTGGSQPISPFVNGMGIPAIALRIPNPDSNIHAANENIRVGNYFEGIATCLAVLTQPFEK